MKKVLFTALALLAISIFSADYAVATKAKVSGQTESLGQTCYNKCIVHDSEYVCRKRCFPPA